MHTYELLGRAYMRCFLLLFHPQRSMHIHFVIGSMPPLMTAHGCGSKARARFIVGWPCLVVYSAHVRKNEGPPVFIPRGPIEDFGSKFPGTSWILAVVILLITAVLATIATRRERSSVDQQHLLYCQSVLVICHSVNPNPLKPYIGKYTTYYERVVERVFDDRLVLIDLSLS